MGDTGPCGPCSEIFYDHGDKIWGGPPGSADADGDRFIEIWNLVFMQYEQQPGEERLSLPKPSIDTGMGLERIAAVLQGTHDNYDIDLFRALIAASVEPPTFRRKASTRPRTASSPITCAPRPSSLPMACCPPTKAAAMCCAASCAAPCAMPNLLGASEPLMHKLVPTLVREMGRPIRNWCAPKDLITETLRLEEGRFRKTLERGLRLLDDESASLKKGDTCSPATRRSSSTTPMASRST
jgi:alanyl-tRNA synthetase